MDQFLSDAKRLKHRLHNHDSSVDILISEATNLQNKLIAMRQYREEVNKLNDTANHRPRSTLILGSQLENQRIQNLETENRELSISLAEHQSALELIMNKYREQVLAMMKANGSESALYVGVPQPVSQNEVHMQEQIVEMAHVMRRATLLDDKQAIKEIELFRQMQVENENLRDLLKISGQKAPPSSYETQLEKLYKEYNIDSKEEISNAILPKHSEHVNNKDSGIYEADYDQYDRPHTLNTNKSKHIYDSLENLYQHDSDKDTEEDQGFSGNKFDDLSPEDETSENCFRAIITDIKPFVEVEEDSSNLNDNNLNDNNLNDESIVHDDTFESNETLDDNLDQENISMKNDKITTVNELNDTMSDSSDIHITTDTHNEIKTHLPNSLKQNHNENNKHNEIPTNNSVDLNNIGKEMEAINLLDDVLDFGEDFDDDLNGDISDNDLNQQNSTTISFPRDSLDNVIPREVLSNGYTNKHVNKMKTNINSEDISKMNASSSYEDSDCESEVTITDDTDDNDAIEIDDVMSCFDSVLEQELENED